MNAPDMISALQRAFVAENLALTARIDEQGAVVVDGTVATDGERQRALDLCADLVPDRFSIEMMARVLAPPGQSS
jgi:hypothetical protein